LTTVDPVGFDAGNADAFSVSDTGMVAYRAGVGGRRQLAWFDGTGIGWGSPVESRHRTCLTFELLRAFVFWVQSRSTPAGWVARVRLVQAQQR
jgi:hypothetical protein